MKREDAEQLRDKLRATHPDRETHTFMLNDEMGEWTVAKVALPPAPDPQTAPASKPSPEDRPDHYAEANLPGGVPNNWL